MHCRRTITKRNRGATGRGNWWKLERMDEYQRWTKYWYCTSFKDFVNVDESLVTSGTLLTDAEILENGRGISDDEEEDDNEDNIDIERVVTPKEAKKPLKHWEFF